MIILNIMTIELVKFEVQESLEETPNCEWEGSIGGTFVNFAENNAYECQLVWGTKITYRKATKVAPAKAEINAELIARPL